MDFLDFRDLLAPASGFQSVQFRILEAKIGLKMDTRHQNAYYKRQLRPEHIQAIKAMENQDSLLVLLDQWLKRIPFWDTEFWKDFEVPEGAAKDLHPFWATYRYTYESGLVGAEIKSIDMSDFDSLFASTDADTEICPNSKEEKICMISMDVLNLFNITSL